MALASVTRDRFQATLAALGTGLLWWRTGSPLSAALALLMSALALLAWASPSRYAPVQRVLDALLHAFLAGLTWLALGVVYFGVFAPLRFLGALLQRDPLRLRRTSGTASCFETPPPAAAKRFERQF